MLGCVTPKWSIRLRKTLNEAAMAASVSCLRTFSTSALEDSSVMSLRSGLTKMTASEPPFGLTLVSLDEIGDVILGIALLQRLVGLGDRCGESGIGLAVAGQRLDDIFDLHFEHDIHAALEVETRFNSFSLHSL